MRALRKACLSGLMSLAVLTAIPVFAVNYISAENFAEANGISHQWFPIQKMLIMRKGINTIKFKIGDKTAITNNKVIQLSAVPKVQNNMIFVPADVLYSVFPKPASTNQQNSVKPPTAVPTQINSSQNHNPKTQSIAKANQPLTEQHPVSADAILIALRHSYREDHTRVVLEFNNPVTYQTEFKNGIYRLTINGCKNLIPTKRTNPVGRDIKQLDLNSGPNREGLILTFTLTQKEKQPIIETVASPFRMIIQLPLGVPEAADPVTDPAKQVIPPPSIQLDTTEEITAVKKIEEETAPEINIEVPMEVLEKKSFIGRTIVIDPGHGGIDTGFEFEGRPSEKNINLETAKHLKTELEKAGFKAVLLRTSDIAMSYTERLTLANKNGGDLFISIHTGGSKDTSKHGIACFTFSDDGTYHNSAIQEARYDAVFDEWIKGTRFDLADFLAKKINYRLTKHLSVDSRGVRKSPILPLKFIINPAVLVEIGMLSDKVEGKNLISDKYRQAIAKSITNAVIDFFNGLQ